MPYRIGVDVGGTFTDAVALNAADLELVGTVKVPTTHDHANGVAEGIRLALGRLLSECRIRPDEVAFIAHGTTQATNALLEGDVDDVAVVSTADGFWSGRVRSETAFDTLELAAGKKITVHSHFVGGPLESTVPPVMQSIHDDGIATVVAAAAYSVDDPGPESLIRELAEAAGLQCTPTHDMSALYGLRTRTRTAIINASILPKMIATTEFMVRGVRAEGIDKPLMIMRSDGGVMNAATVRQRPIQTVLSGPAAGVAGALLYGRIAEGIFLEVGGTSTDVSAIHNGRVMIKWAEIGGHKTYVNSLDIHTAAVAGGSLLRSERGAVVCGPRSAHIAGLEYCCFADDLYPCCLRIEPFSPPGDEAEYLILADGSSGKNYAITVTCLANYAGYIPEGDFARGNPENVGLALECLSRYLGKPADTIVEEAFSSLCGSLEEIVTELTDRYRLERGELTLVGGGGGWSAVVPVLAEHLGMAYTQCPNAHVISPIGVAMAMVREVCERTLASPTREELHRLREEAVLGAVRAGAARDTVEVVLETEPRKNLVRAIATGVTDGNLISRNTTKVAREELLEAAKKRAGASPTLQLEAANGHYHLFQFQNRPKSWWRALFGPSEMPVFVFAADGSLKLHRTRGAILATTAAGLPDDLNAMLDKHSTYGDIGEKIPDVFLVAGDRLFDYSMLREREQVVELARFETEGMATLEDVFIVFGL